MSAYQAAALLLLGAALALAALTDEYLTAFILAALGLVLAAIGEYERERVADSRRRNPAQARRIRQ